MFLHHNEQSATSDPVSSQIVVGGETPPAGFWARLRYLLGTALRHLLVLSLARISIVLIVLGMGLAIYAWLPASVQRSGTPHTTHAGTSDSTTAPGTQPDGSKPAPEQPKPNGAAANGPNSTGGSGGASGGTGSSSPAPSGWPGPGNTGVPAGTHLTAYGGCGSDGVVITAANTVIDSKQVDCDLIIRATGVVIKNSLIKGTVNTAEEQVGSFTITDSEVTGGMGTKNITALRVNVHGGAGPNVYCFTTCDIRDSWLHSPSYPSDNPQAHLGAFLANDDGPDGNTTSVTLIHNTILCDTAENPPDGGCSGDVNLFGDFGTITHVTVDGNYLGGSNGISYCFYGGESSTKPYPHADHVVFTNNVFQKAPTGHCGAYGPVTGFNVNGTGNVWSNNKFDDGTVVEAED